MPMLLYGNGMISGATSMPTNVQFGGTVGVTGALNTSSTFTTSGALTASNGIVFPATQAASANANTLDDYEEGTWTPSAWNADTGAALSTPSDYSITQAAYQKIGRYVWCLIRFYDNRGTKTQVKISLPFNPNAGDYVGGSFIADGSTVGQIFINSDSATLRLATGQTFKYGYFSYIVQ